MRHYLRHKDGRICQNCTCDSVSNETVLVERKEQRVHQKPKPKSLIFSEFFVLKSNVDELKNIFGLVRKIILSGCLSKNNKALPLG